ncbi:MAG: hypothetical protein KatS3mg105_2848 [Gemmatales bacterium]|nr:MAG: hypothetical protein KatS3mg105_2848 [Gemmatales bacterium]
MSIWRLVTREIRYRPANFCLAVLSVSIAVGCVVAQVAILHSHDRRTEELVAAAVERTEKEKERVEKETAEKVKKYEDAVRKNMRNLGFNVLVLSEKEDVHRAVVEHTFTAFIPEEYVDKLANSKIATINHLLPMIQRKMDWPEMKDRLSSPVIVVGIRGEVPFKYKNPKKPLLQRVPPGKMVVGYRIHTPLKLAEGDTVTFMGRPFTVHKLNPPTDVHDDGTIWINLEDAQQLFGCDGKINAIQALECNCASVDRLAEIREEIAALLPNTQVLELRSKALARAEARKMAKKTGEERLRDVSLWAENQVQQVKDLRQAQRDEKREVGFWLGVCILLGCISWLAILTFANVRERSLEIGILRALGVRTADVFWLFLGKAALIGLVGSLLGFIVGTLVGNAIGEGGGSRLDTVTLLSVVLATPVICCVAGWLPARFAARQDPAVILREG